MGLLQCLDLLYTVAAHWVGQVLLGVLEPRIEGGRLLGEQQVELFDLPETVLHLLQLLLAVRGVLQELLPALDHHGVPVDDGRGGAVSVGHQLVLHARQIVDAFLLEGHQGRLECVLFGQERLHRVQVAPIVVRPHVILLFRCKE